MMQFTRGEILEAVQAAPGRCYLGEGKDAGIYEMRLPDDPRWPWFNVGFGWICTSEEMASNQIEALASLQKRAAMKFPNLDELPRHPHRRWIADGDLRFDTADQDRPGGDEAGGEAGYADHEPADIGDQRGHDHCGEHAAIRSAAFGWLACGDIAGVQDRF